MALERLQKIIARAGLASRRGAEELITAGRVRVNGRVVTELGTKADDRKDKIEVDGKRIEAEDLVYIVFHKPRNVVSTVSDPEGRPTVADRVVEPRFDPRTLLRVMDVSTDDPLRDLLADDAIEVRERVALALAGPAFQWR